MNLNSTSNSLQSSLRWNLTFTLLLIVLQFSSFVSSAQFSTQYNFGSADNGHSPFSSPITDGTFLYGMTYDGGVNNSGIIYKIKPDGSGFTKLYDLNETSGTYPYGSLFYDGSFLYGMASNGGSLGFGTIFKIKTDGTGFAKIFDFDYTTTGASPYGSLISDGTFLYGTTVTSTTTFGGTIFKIKPDGTGFSKLYEFDTNTTGSYAYGALLYDGTYLYGTTSGGFFANGTMFKIKTDGTGFQQMVTFNSSATGRRPYGSLISDGTALYGTTLQGGSNNLGSIFRILPDGTGFTQIYSFNNTVPGAAPKGGLTYDGTYFYGMTTDYGADGRGMIFRINTNGTGILKLADATVGTVGPYPEGTLLLQGSTLIGIKSGDGAGAAPFPPGTLFKINTDGTGYTQLRTFEYEATEPPGALFSDGTYQYGVSSKGGLYKYGTIFKVKLDGTGFVRLLDFTGLNGKIPQGSLVSDGTFLYGTTSQGGTSDGGVLFRIKPDGTGFAKLIDFDFPTTGSVPVSSVIYDGVSALYGMASHGGADNSGIIFKINTDGSGYTKLMEFEYVASGANPETGFVSDGTFLYGMTPYGGTNGYGVIFKVKKDGTGYVKLLEFDYDNGSYPHGSLTIDGGFLYGMSAGGGLHSNGTAFKIKTDGSGFTKLFDFDAADTGNPGNSTFISDGTYLYASLLGGVNGKGTIFRIKTDGSGYEKYIDMVDGDTPAGSLTTDGTFLYGVTTYGGSFNSGTYFKSTKAPFVTIAKFSPEEGAEGTYITIKGTGFSPVAASNIVKFNGVTAKVVSSSTNSMQVIVPVGATSGPVSITSSTTGVSASDFIVTAESALIDGNIVQNCNVKFVFTDNSYDAVQTFLPVNAGDKVKVLFTSIFIEDILEIHDGPDTSYPLLAKFEGQHSIPPEIVATNSAGALTFSFIWEDETSHWEASISCQSAASPITFTSQPSDFSDCAGSVATFSAPATGTTNITYQWQLSSTKTGTYADITNGPAYSNATTSSLSVNTKGNVGAGFYRCKVNGDMASTVFSNAAQLTIKSTGCGPAIAATQVSTQVGGQITIDLIPLITVPGKNLDLASLQVTTALPSGATTSISSAGVLTINYSGNGFTGVEPLTIKACDTNGNCATQTISVTVAGEVVVYNGVSPNADGKNDFLYLENINLIEDAKTNHVTIFNRWGDQVYEADNYDNNNVAFDGRNKSGGNLPSGTYFYKITFTSGRKTMTGYLSLKRQ